MAIVPVVVMVSVGMPVMMSVLVMAMIVRPVVMSMNGLGQIRGGRHYNRYLRG